MKALEIAKVRVLPEYLSNDCGEILFSAIKLMFRLICPALVGDFLCMEHEAYSSDNRQMIYLRPAPPDLRPCDAASRAMHDHDEVRQAIALCIPASRAL